MSRKIGTIGALALASTMFLLSACGDSQEVSPASGQSNSAVTDEIPISGDDTDDARMSALEAIVAEQQAALDQLPEASAGITFSAEAPNVLVYTAAATSGVDPAAAGAQMQTTMESEGVSESTCANFFSQAETKYGAEGPWVIRYDFSDEGGTIAHSFEIDCK